MKSRNLFRACILVVSVFTFVFLNGCDKPEEETPVQETSTVTDIEGNVYKTININGTWWMAENLRTTKFQNGNYIQNKKDSIDWSGTVTAGYCVYENKQDNFTKYGLLYNWFAISDTSKLAPAGWHIPSDSDWKALETFLGMSQPDADKLGWRGYSEGDKLKLAGNNGWSPYGDVWATNESGFTAIAGSCRLPNSEFGQPGLFATGFWWSLSEFDTDEVWYRYLDYKNSNVFRSHESKNYGFSVRCVKD